MGERTYYLSQEFEFKQESQVVNQTKSSGQDRKSVHIRI